MSSRIAELSKIKMDLQMKRADIKHNSSVATAATSSSLEKNGIAKSKLWLERWKTIFGFMGPLMRDFSPYLVLILLVLLLIGLAATPAPRPTPGRTLPTSSWSKMIAAIKAFMDRIFPTQSLRRWFNPFGKVESIARTQNAGRCDNAKWRQQDDPSEPYGGGLCTRTTDPKPFEWQIDTSKNPDFDRLPTEIQSELTGGKTKVYIPYAKQATFYVPQCNEAYYKVVKDGKEIERKFADDGTPLLIDNGLTCSLASKPLGDVYTSKYRRPENATAPKRDQVESCTI